MESNRSWQVLAVLVGIVWAAGFAPASKAAELRIEGPPLAVGPGGATLTSGAGVSSHLVYLTPASEGEAAAGAARSGVRRFAASAGGRIHYEYWLLGDVLNVRGLRPSQIETLRTLPGVVSVVEDYPVHAALNGSIPRIGGLQQQITAAGMAADGEGLRVCVIDTGVNPNHVLFEDRIDTAAGFDFVNDDPNPTDDNTSSHGSNVSGIAVGGDGFTVNFGSCGPQPFQGVAPEATLIAVKALDANGNGFASDIIAAIEHCADDALPNGPADVINLSLGGGQFGTTCDGDSLAQAANAAVASGVVVVAAAGNDAFVNALSTPACASGVIAVGATYDADYPSCDVGTGVFTFTACTDVNPFADDVACFSNHSVNLDVTAPGCVSFSASKTSSTSLIGLCGTSQASPHVAGLAALLLDVDPSLTPAEVRQAIRDGAIDLGPAGFDAAYGHGRIDVLATLQNRCGNGLLEAGEECDDGNAVLADGCDACQIFDCPTTSICTGGCENSGECNTVETGQPLCETPNSIIECPRGETIRIHVCACDEPPPSGDPGGFGGPTRLSHISPNGPDLQCGQNVTWSCH